MVIVRTTELLYRIESKVQQQQRLQQGGREREKADVEVQMGREAEPFMSKGEW